MKAKTLIILLLLLILPIFAEAQCAMCRAVLQNGESQNMAEGVNNGILYLMIFPYLLMGGVGYYIYRMMRSNKKS